MGRISEWLGLAGWIAASFAAAAVGSQVTDPEWYRSLARPAWAPRGWVFGPVWTTLYTMMGIAAWLVWRRGGFAGAPLALGLFVAQLALNAAWSWLFFGMRRAGLAFGEIVVLWILILATTIVFGREARLAGWLMAPYLAWVAFAAVLNFTLWRMGA